ncbi:hypothetical protein [Fictibacillus sp. 26RED30]|uniref:hypothetical protein n=1 Tax=Fictibacillus sp. 26RED30 TaxID=2745877 RepID=UPI0018CDF088|nr:hypothetical protein [Fictibacillus sp. 26RED30]MBH0161398.1 hypothetical protein [Fictibacillus sp. 26RED30]
MNKKSKGTVIPINSEVANEGANIIPMKTEVQVKETETVQEPAKIIFITSGFGKIHVSPKTNTNPMAIAA